MLWTKFGNGTADVEVFTEALTRAGLPVVAPLPDWNLGNVVAELTYVPKNKPFLIGETSMPSDAQTYLDACAPAGLTARWLLREFCPCHDPRWASGVFGGCYGCKSDDIADFGRVYSSKTSLAGFVEGIISSLANWKLYSLGIKHREWTLEFITLDTAQLFSHPLRPAEQVPAGVMIHTAYCCAHLLEWYEDVIKYDASLPGAQYRMDVFRERAQRATVQLEMILTTPQVTPAGLELLTAMHLWITALLES